MSGRAWAIKLGSVGVCVPFCEQHGIVGVGWRGVDPTVLATASRDAIWQHIASVCTWYRGEARAIGAATGQLYRFARECKEGDFILYYDPSHKHVRIGLVTSGPLYRDFDLSSNVDIWHYRKVLLADRAIPILDFYGGLKGRLLGPRMSFWELQNAHATVNALYKGVTPGASGSNAKASPQITPKISQRTSC